MKILFQGDSITDAGRNTENGSMACIGQGYALIVSAKLGFENPKKYEIVNRGISGNRIVDVYSRIKIDCWNEEPDVLSILVGVNDVWHELSKGNGVEIERYENIYDTMLRETIERFPDIKIIMLEPFVLKGSATEEHWEFFRTEVAKRAAVDKNLAAKYNTNVAFVALQDKFDEAEKLAGAEYWLADGVHPTPFGHQLIAEEWLKVFKKTVG